MARRKQKTKRDGQYFFNLFVGVGFLIVIYFLVQNYRNKSSNLETGKVPISLEKEGDAFAENVSQHLVQSTTPTPSYQPETTEQAPTCKGYIMRRSWKGKISKRARFTTSEKSISWIDSSGEGKYVSFLVPCDIRLPDEDQIVTREALQALFPRGEDYYDALYTEVHVSDTLTNTY